VEDIVKVIANRTGDRGNNSSGGGGAWATATAATAARSEARADWLAKLDAKIAGHARGRAGSAAGDHRPHGHAGR